MFEWPDLTAANNGAMPTLGEIALRLILSLVLGVVVAGVYVLTQRKSRSELLPMATTLVLLTVLIAMVTLIIGNNVARAFSLAGALAIIRFRTVVEDTRDTAFVIFAVVVGMGAGTGLVAIALLGIPIVTAAALVLSLCAPAAPTSTASYSLSVRLSLGRNPADVLREVFGQHVIDCRLRATTTARQGSALDVDYVVRLRDEREATRFVAELNHIEGVQNVELRQL